MRREKESIEAGTRQQSKVETLKREAFNFYTSNLEALYPPRKSGCSLAVDLAWFSGSYCWGKPKIVSDLDGDGEVAESWQSVHCNIWLAR